MHVTDFSFSSLYTIRICDSRNRLAGDTLYFNLLNPRNVQVIRHKLYYIYTIVKKKSRPKTFQLLFRKRCTKLFYNIKYYISNGGR